MFRKYNKKVLTVILAVVVGIGLIGPGALLIFSPAINYQQPEVVDGNLISQPTDDLPAEEAIASSSAQTE